MAGVSQMAEPSLARSGVKTTDGQGDEAHQVRTSSNTFIQRGHDEKIGALEHRVHELTRTWYAEGEHIQVIFGLCNFSQRRHVYLHAYIVGRQVY